jgi:hypothetical protein
MFSGSALPELMQCAIFKVMGSPSNFLFTRFFELQSSFACTDRTPWIKFEGNMRHTPFTSEEGFIRRTTERCHAVERFLCNIRFSQSY